MCICADRIVSRGRRDALEFHSWSREMHFAVKVRDYEFWNSPNVKSHLASALTFMTGDAGYEFAFEPGHSTPPTGLFDSSDFARPKPGTDVTLFSGGVDSLTGAIQFLEENSDSSLCLVSHQGQPGTTHTQNQLYRALRSIYGSRVSHYCFNCTLSGRRAQEESQRTRAFLYLAIAYALSSAFAQRRVLVYENGVTSLNFPRRQDLMNARASRTTHPKTLNLMQSLFSDIAGAQIAIEAPFVNMTKTDVLHALKSFKREALITSSVSCSKTFQNMRAVTHCGGCSQCVDRRFAAFASGLQNTDHAGLYADDFISNPIEDGEVRTTIIDFARQAHDFSSCNADKFYQSRLVDLAEICDQFPPEKEMEVVQRIWQLCQRHGDQVLSAIHSMRDICDNAYSPIPHNSFLQLVAEREYLKRPTARFVADASATLRRSIPITFRKNRPKDENDFNDKVQGLLTTEGERLLREHPVVRFALASAVPDHSSTQHDVFIESKYIRAATTPSKVNEGMAADLTKYPADKHILFIVYDPDRAITDDDQYASDFQSKRPCTVTIVR